MLYKFGRLGPNILVFVDSMIGNDLTIGTKVDKNRSNIKPLTMFYGFTDTDNIC
jgi:hypothetical protein